jgi:hypothetical protein
MIKKVLGTFKGQDDQSELLALVLRLLHTSDNKMLQSMLISKHYLVLRDLHCE